MSTNVVKTEKRNNRKPDKKAVGKTTTTKSKNGAKPIVKNTAETTFVDLMGKYENVPFWEDFEEGIRKGREEDRKNFKE
jgi:hypothetical protein